MNITKEQLLAARQSYFENGFVCLKQYFDTQMRAYLKEASVILTSLAETEVPSDKNGINGNNNSYCIYGSATSDILTSTITSFYSALTDKNLKPTYSYFRTYVKGQDLNMHTDRPACQFSSTIQLNRSHEQDWTFYVKNLNNEIVSIDTEPGDIIFYQGCKVEHGRQSLQYDWSSHIFMHYVDSNDPEYNQWVYDKRPGLGLPENTRS